MGSFLEGLYYLCLIDIIPNIHFWGIRKKIYTLAGMKIGKNSRILRKTVVISPKNINIGDNVYINEYCYLDGRGGITISDNTSISVFSYINTGYHAINKPGFDYEKKAVNIGSKVFIGAHSVILAGAELDDGVVVCVGSVVKSGLYEECGIYSGVPAFQIGARNKGALSYELDYWKPWFR